MKAHWILIILLGLPSITLAMNMPKTTPYDTHIQYVNYNEKDVVAIRAYPGVATQIRFNAEEEILDIAAGFSQGWEFSSRGNNLYLKPKSIPNKNNSAQEPIAKEWDTNLMVTTNHHVYAFQLMLLPTTFPSEISKDITYRLDFKYPLEEANKARQAAQLNATEKLLAQNTLPLNWNYSMQVAKGSEQIAPSLAYDDGRFTYLKFPASHELPAVFIVATDKSERLVNTHIDPQKPDTLVIQQIAPEIALRLGTQVVGIFNENNKSAAIWNDNGTVSAQVKRVIK